VSAALDGSTGAPAYAVRVERGLHGWEVRIVDAEGSVVSVRPCASETEARTYASTVIQHLGWLSPEKFREYYRLDA
jgi:hypothetical protein